MKIIKPSVEFIQQEPGVLGMKKLIELAGRVCYKSEDKITDTSCDGFIDRMYKSGHWKVLEFGNIYLDFLRFDKNNEWPLLKNIGTYLYQKHAAVDPGYRQLNYKYKNQYRRLICVTLRNLIQRAEKDNFKIDEVWRTIEGCWIDPSEIRKRFTDPEFNKEDDLSRPIDSLDQFVRVTSHWICSRACSHQLVRHGILSSIQESQRYCNYSKEKFGGLTFIIPGWALELSKETNGEEFVKNSSPEEIWEDLKKSHEIIRKRDDWWNRTEDEYFTELSLGLKPEQARGVLNNDIKTELYLSGFFSDWYSKSSKGSFEKCGFINLRSSSAAQDEIRELTKEFSNKLNEYKTNNLTL